MKLFIGVVVLLTVIGTLALLRANGTYGVGSQCQSEVLQQDLYSAGNICFK